jgi:hypothetical protein
LDQRSRWLRGEFLRAETYAEKFPSLWVDPDAFVDLIYNEIVLREQTGERPHLDEYLRRLGQFEPQLRQLFEVHEALRPGQYDKAV